MITAAASTTTTNTSSKKMPGPQKTLRLPSPYSKKKVSKPSPLRLPVQSSDSEDESKSGPFLWRKKVRLICTDPDATDSSSDEEMEEQQRPRCPKRLVREIFIPAHCSPYFDKDEDAIFSYQSQCLSLQSMPTGSGLSQMLPTNRRTSSKFSLKEKSLSLKKSKSKKNPHNLVGVRQRRRGKWAAEIRDSARGIRLWLGTYDNPLAAATAYEMASRKLRGCPMPLKQELVSSGQRSNSSGSLNYDEKEEKDFADDGSALSANSIASILNEDNEHVSGCSDLESIMKSPSSVLEDPISSGSEGGFDSAGIPGKGSVLVDDYCFADVKSGEAFPSMAAQNNLVEDVCIDPSILVPPFMEENLSYGGLEHIFDINVLGGGNADDELLDGFEDDILVGDESIEDISFDLDTDSLAWIDIPEDSR